MLKNIDWNEEFLNIEFHDLRLKKRFFKILDDLKSSPALSILSAAGSRSDAKGTYRFLASDKIDYDEMLDSVALATSAKIDAVDSEKILLIQDTTSIGYNHNRKIKNMGYYSDSSNKGMLLHSCIALTENGVPIGLVYQEALTREKRKNNSLTKDQKRNQPVEQKEIYRWMKALEESNRRLSNDKQKITICDRGGDFYELFSLAYQLNEYYLIRAVQNRTLENENTKLIQKVKASPILGSMIIQMSRNPVQNEPARKVKMYYQCITTRIKCPKRRREKHLEKSITVNMIYIHGEGKDKDLHWFLITNVPLKDNDEIEKYIGYYALRWKIERFHFVLKSGCKIKMKQCRSFDNLKLLTLLYSIISIKIMNAYYLGKEYPHLGCDILLDENEWKLLYCCSKKVKKVPTNIEYTLRDVICDL